MMNQLITKYLYVLRSWCLFVCPSVSGSLPYSISVGVESFDIVWMCTGIQYSRNDFEICRDSRKKKGKKTKNSYSRHYVP
mmetsp:Transcript_18680/g.52231  ORF Transcript_18680/g.52231 Transcript_18680/m.52231 type:complete len:80 (+) Transcript_18680:2075-2314(+)